MEDFFDQAADIARDQDALFWEPRIALSVARPRMTQGRDDEAKALLTPICFRFTDGFITSGPRAARAILDAYRHETVRGLIVVRQPARCSGVRFRKDTAKRKYRMRLTR